jgi:hypothetical protein
MMEAILFSETSVLTRATLYNIPEDGLLVVNEMIELVSGMPAPQFGDESS